MREPLLDGRVQLRPWQAGDLDALVEHANDAAVSRGLSTRFPFPYTRADGEAFLGGQVLDLRAPVFALVIDGHAGGGIGVAQGQAERRYGASLGYWLGQRHWGQGIMTAVVGAYVPWVMDTLELARLSAQVMAGNPASARVLLKNGFVEEGTERQSVFKDGQLHDMRCFAHIRTWLQSA
ncbi:MULTISPECIES: GNAT family N-acetyltransferase [Stenotrophomonas]|uniref:GNAT family N-acetyltransferase n=1 Tax=Stenotrophomonas TaxID=40323 RepID=UPI0007705BFD|nr:MULTISPECIES: GNAT family N-acetyltransferase [Stenotrophomonas]AMJ58618.1 acetyltransferase [Stenotrophomonas sp. KCTC 12332]